jgi:hypothetical protein
MLAKRLAKHRLVFSGGLLATTLAHRAAAAAVPHPLIVATINAASAFAAVPTAATAGLVSAPVAVLTEGVLRAMFLTKLKIASVVLVVASLCGTAGLLTLHAGGDQALASPPASGAIDDAGFLVQKKPVIDAANSGATDVRGALKSLDIKKGLITLTVPAKVKGQPGEDKTFSLAKDVKVAVDDGRGMKSINYRAGALADLKEGTEILAAMSADQKEVVAIRAQGAAVAGVLKAVDVEKNTITITFRKKTPDDQDHTYIVAKDAKIVVDGKAGRFTELAAEALVTLKLSGDQKQVGMIVMEGPTVQGLLKAVDLVKGAITLTITKKGDPTGDDVVYAVAKDAKIFAYGKETGLKDLPMGGVLDVKLRSDRKMVGAIQAQTASVRGLVKAVDAGKNTVTVLVSSKTQPAEEKTFNVAKDAPIGLAGGKTGMLAELEKDRQVTLWLSNDQKQVVSISAGKASK